MIITHTDENGHDICDLHVSFDSNDLAESLGILPCLATSIITDAYVHLLGVLDEEINATAELFLRGSGSHQGAGATPTSGEGKGNANAKSRKRSGRAPRALGLFSEPKPGAKYLPSHQLLCDSDDIEREPEALIQTSYEGDRHAHC